MNILLTILLVSAAILVFAVIYLFTVLLLHECDYEIDSKTFNKWVVWYILPFNYLHHQCNHLVDLEWDTELNQLMDEHKFTPIDKYTAQIGDKTVWISNFPYSSLCEYNYGCSKKYPKMSTILRAGWKLRKDFGLDEKTG